MFEEDLERCFICQAPAKGLYCSSDCRQKDQGVTALHAAPERPLITSQVPPALSPYVRPTNTIGLSPRSSGLPRFNGTYSDSSSATSSPLQSPRTNPIDGDSPQKGLFDLPPSAYPSKPFSTIPSSIPMKIPGLLPKSSPIIQPAGTPGSYGSTVYPIGASIDTLRFGRRPGAVNSVTSPNALNPRCACGLPANHKKIRALSKERTDPVDSGFSRLSLGPSVVAREEPVTRSLRIVSDSAIPHFTLSPKPKPESIVGTHSGPHHHTSEGSSPVGPSSPLSRTRSDPISPRPRSTVPISPKIPKIAPSPLTSPPEYNTTQMSQRPSQRDRTNALDVVNVGSIRRGRSREKQDHEVDMTGCNGILHNPPEREPAPSRSRNRRDSRRRSGDRSRSRAREPRDRMRVLEMSREREQLSPDQRSPVSSPHSGSHQILPSWSRSITTDDGRKPKEGVAPASKRHGSSQQRMSERDEDEERKREGIKRATNQLGHVFGIAAG